MTLALADADAETEKARAKFNMTRRGFARAAAVFSMAADGSSHAP